MNKKIPREKGESFEPTERKESEKMMLQSLFRVFKEFWAALQHKLQKPTLLHRGYCNLETRNASHRD